MNIGVPREGREGERRVALVADGVKKLVARGFTVLVESGAGREAGVEDAAYQEAGARLVTSRAEVLGADVVLKVDRPLPGEVEQMAAGTVLVAMLQHLSDGALVADLEKRGITAFAMDWMPRITRAQEMDARSSMSTVQGYKAVLLAADSLPRFMPMLMTAAGTVAPSHVLVIGAGVAGLSAIATARRLGAVVEGFDVRPATREQVESLGARFLAMDSELSGAQDEQGYATAQGEEVLQLERQTIARRLPATDAVITTALIPGKQPPLLITREMVASMRPGSVIVDLAAGAGGNCELTEPGRAVVAEGVQIIGFTDLESRVPVHSSQMYSRNVTNFLLHLLKGGSPDLGSEDELIRFPMVTSGNGGVAAKS